MDFSADIVHKKCEVSKHLLKSTKGDAYGVYMQDLNQKSDKITLWISSMKKNNVQEIEVL
jgi:hypothetical protein